MSSCTIFIALFNEHDTLRSVVEGFLALRGTVGVELEVCIIDDGSTDGSSELADELARMDGVRVVHHAVNQGLGGVYQTAFHEACGTYWTLYAADGQFSPTLLPRYLAAMEGGADIALGRMEKRIDSAVGAFLSCVERWLYRAWVGKMPEFQGILMIRKAVLDGIPLMSTGRGWGIVMELIYKVARTNVNMIHVPCEVLPRRFGKSKVNNLRGMWTNFKQLLALRKAVRAK